MSCSIDTCDRPHYARSWCKLHYARWRNTGDPTRVLDPYPKRNDLATMRSKSVVSAGGCWEWRGYVNKGGYGRTSYENRRWLAHRLTYTLANGPIPEGMTVDHMCFNPSCINPDHLRLLSLSDNSSRHREAFKTHCKRGHEFTPENTTLGGPTGRSRSCRTCAAIRFEKFKAKRRSAS